MSARRRRTQSNPSYLSDCYSSSPASYFFAALNLDITSSPQNTTSFSWHSFSFEFICRRSLSFLGSPSDSWRGRKDFLAETCTAARWPCTSRCSGATKNSEDLWPSAYWPGRSSSRQCSQVTSYRHLTFSASEPATASHSPLASIPSTWAAPPALATASSPSWRCLLDSGYVSEARVYHLWPWSWASFTFDFVGSLAMLFCWLPTYMSLSAATSVHEH